MKKRIIGRKFSRTSNERKQLMRNLVASAVDNGFIVTSVAKAKSVRPMLEKLITTAKKGDLTSIRQLMKKTGNIKTARKLIELGKLFQARPGGYTRIIHLENQKGDNTHKVRFELVEQLAKAEIVTAKTTQAMPVEKVSSTAKAEKLSLPQKKQLKTKSEKKPKKDQKKVAVTKKTNKAKAK